MPSKTVIAFVALVVVTAGVLGALVLVTPTPEDTTITAKFTSLVDGSTVSGALNITANVTSKKDVSYAVLKLDGTSIGNCTAAPFYWLLNTPEIAEGQHILNLTAANSAGHQGQSQLTITVNNGGTTVAIVSPTNASHVTGNVSISAEVVSPRSISYVSFIVDDVQVANLTSAPYTVHWNSSASVNGEHEIRVVARDSLSMNGNARVAVVIDNPFSFVDARGVTVQFPGIPKHIVSLGNSFTEVLFAVGAGEQVAGRDSKSTYPAAASNITDVGTYYPSCQVENIIPLNPDCIVVWKFATNAITTLEGAPYNYRVVALNPSNVSTVLTEIVDVGKISGHQAEAERIVANMTERIHAAEAKVPTLPDQDKPKVYFELRNGNTVNGKTISGEIISMAGGFNIYWNATKSNPLPSYEYVIQSMPNVIALENQSPSSNADIAARAGWDVIPAVQQNHIYRINGEWMTASPRLVDALEQFVKWFYPS
jgi:iron complex transport system substrate-binding protein